MSLRLIILLTVAVLRIGAQYSVTVTGTRFQEFVDTGESAEVRVSSADARAAERVSVRVNGEAITDLRTDVDPAVRIAKLAGLKPGVNRIEVFASKSAKSSVVARIISTPILPSIACAQLTGVALTGLDPSDKVLIESAVPFAAAPPLPAHCVVRGSANPHTGANNTQFSIGFEVRLPEHWSGRFLFQGGGGNDGPVSNVTGKNTGAPGSPSALEHGFAVAATDGGHSGRTAESFGFDQLARVDHAYNAFGKTAQIAKALIHAYYGAGPARSYVIGCSGGGRQTMMFTQRFPDYFDGAVACAPAMRVSSGATISAAWESKLYRDIAPDAPGGGGPILSRAFTDDDLNLLSMAILKACDSLDGTADGAVNDYRGCHFDPKSVECAVSAAPSKAQGNCLSARQVQALQSGFAGPHNAEGKALYTAWPWDPGVSSPGWRQWKIGNSLTATPNSAFASLMQDALAHEFFTPFTPAFSIFDFDIDRDPVRMQAESAIYDTYRDDRLAAFHARGGKLIFIHGMADPIFSAFDTMDYYNRLATHNGGAEKLKGWARAFFVPGMTHCAGGPSTDIFDGLASIIDWVENNAAPERIIARGSAVPGRTRPLCVYPAEARYSGRGSVDDAGSFICR